MAWAARWGNAVREAQPCVLFPPSQVAGRASLQATTLKSLGLTGGSAIIRWGPQSPSSGKQGRMAEKMGTSPPDCGPVPLIWDPGPMAAHSPGACAAAAGLGGGGWPGGAGAGSTFGGPEDHVRGQETQAGGRAPCGGSLALWVCTLRFAMRRCSSAGLSRSRAPGSPTASLSADQAAGSPLPPLGSAGLSRGDVSHQDEADISGAGRVDTPAKQISKEPAPAPFVPFSGGGQRLGGPSGLARSLMSPSAKLPKSFSSPGGPSKPKKSRPGQEPPPEAEPVRSRLGAGAPSSRPR